MRRWIKRLLGAGAFAAIAYWLWRLVDEQQRTTTIDWVPQPFPSPPVPVPHPREPADAVTVSPDGDHCPASHPVKAKLSSGIYHLPGGRMYDRTIPDRCYRDAAAAEADGLRASKR